MKNERTLVYRVSPAYSSTTNSDNNLFSDGLSPVPDDGSPAPARTSSYLSELYSGSYANESEQRIETDKGVVLAKSDKISSSSISKTSFTDQAYSITGIGNSLTYSRQEVTHLIDPVFIDARFGFCIASESQYESSMFGGGSDPGETAFDIPETSIRKDFYSSWLDGVRIGEAYTEDSESVVVTSIGILTGDSLNDTGEPTTRTAVIESDFIALESFQFVGGFAYKSGKITFSSMVFTRAVLGDLRLFQFNLLTGKSEPVINVIERDPEDDYFFHRVGLY